MSAKREVIPLSARAPDAASGCGQTLSMAVRGGDFLFVSGLTAVDLKSGERMQGTTASETRQILTNLKQLLDAAGSSLDKVVKVNVLLHSMLEERNMNEVYARFFPRSATGSDRLWRTPSRWRESDCRMHRAGVIR